MIFTTVSMTGDKKKGEVVVLNVEQKIIELKADRKKTKKNLNANMRKLKMAEKEKIKFLKGRELLISFASQLQQDFKKEIETLLTLAIQSVFKDRKYTFRLDFNERADRIDAVPVVITGKLELIPKDDMGGGALPVIGFPMRVVLLGGSRPLIWLDEPLKGSLGRSDESFFRAIKMFKEISEGVGIQIILNTHEADIAELADTIHEVKHNGKKSVVRRVKPKRSVFKRG